MFFSFTHQGLPSIYPQTTKHICAAQILTSLWFTRTWDRGQIPFRWRSIMISAQPHLGQQVQTDQTIHLTPNALPSPCKLAYQQQALRLRQQNTSATTDILVRAGRGRGFSSFAPRTILFHVLCKTASSQCLLMVSAGWQLVPQGAFASPLITGG